MPTVTPVQPPDTPWVFPDPELWDAEDDLVAVGADLEAGTLLRAYSHGLFPMPIGPPQDPMGWFSPVRRGVLPLDGLKVSRSLRRSAKDVEIRVDTAFEEVIDACGDRRRPDGWITRDVRAAYLRAPRARLGALGRGVARRALWWAGCTAWRSAGSSPGSRCSTASATPPRWR